MSSDPSLEERLDLLDQTAGDLENQMKQLAADQETFSARLAAIPRPRRGLWGKFHGWTRLAAYIELRKVRRLRASAGHLSAWVRRIRREARR